MTHFEELLIGNGYVNDNDLLVNSLTQSPFEALYSTVRQKEGRVFTDEEVANLPEVHHRHPHRKEWAIRRASAGKLVRYLKSRRPYRVVEIGCGNGWLINSISKSFQVECLGIDTCLGELSQAVRVFGDTDRLTFSKADVLSDSLANLRAEQIILAATIQYFPDLKKLLSSVLGLLQPSGELHIVDSPLYSDGYLEPARQHSAQYFSSIGHPTMSNYYFHHAWTALKTFDFELKYSPHAWLLKTVGRMKPLSPFPWIIVRPTPVL